MMSEGTYRNPAYMRATSRSNSAAMTTTGQSSRQSLGLKSLRQVSQLPASGRNGELVLLYDKLYIYHGPTQRWMGASDEYIAYLKRKQTVYNINKTLHEKAKLRKAELLQKSVVEVRQEYNLPAVIPPEIPLKNRLDFWNYPDWDKAGNLRQGGQPFWMFDNAEPRPESIPEPPKPTHKAVKKRVGSTYITVMEKII